MDDVQVTGGRSEATGRAAAGEQSREYVIERSPQPDGGTIYGAYRRDHTGFAPFGHRLIAVLDTITGLREMMERHYPGAICFYAPEDVSAAVEDAMRAADGGDGTDEAAGHGR